MQSVSDTKDKLKMMESAKENYSPVSQEELTPALPSYMRPTVSWKVKESKEKRASGGSSKSKKGWDSSFSRRKVLEKETSLIGKSEQPEDEELFSREFDALSCSQPHFMLPTVARKNKIRRPTSGPESRGSIRASRSEAGPSPSSPTLLEISPDD